MERFTPRWFCAERVAHAQTMSALCLPVSLCAAVSAHLYDSTSCISTILAGEAAIHSLFTGALWATGKLGRKAAFAHDSEKYEKRSKKSKATLGHHPVQFKTAYREDDLVVPDEKFGLTPNDVYQWSPQGTWIRKCSKYLNQSILPEINPYPIEAFIRKEYTFEPHKITDTDPLIIVVTHGTFGSQTASYYKDYSQFPLETGVSPQNYRHIERFATRLGDAQGQVVHLLSFRWSGDLDDGERIVAAKILAAILNKNFPSSRPLLIGHSHGCNVHRHASQLLLHGVGTMVHFAPPYRSEKEYAPQNVGRSISFSSPDDIIARGGQIPESILLPISPAIETGMLTAIGYLIPQVKIACLTTGAVLWAAELVQALPYFLKNPLSAPKESNFADIRIIPTINGKSLGHSEMTNMSRYLWPIWCHIGLMQGAKTIRATIQTEPTSLKLEETSHQ